MAKEFTADELKQTEEAFWLLEARLAVTPLPTSDGGTRIIADADEFLLMEIPRRTDTRYAFKHRVTRNYVFIDAATGALEVPCTGKEFFRGYFDGYDEKITRDKP